MTPQQLKLIHVARRQLALDDADYRQVLRQKGGVASSKDLSPRGFEDVMAHFEHMGFVHPAGGGRDYWRKKQFNRGIFADARAVHLIRQLARGHRYQLAGLVLRFSDGRTDQVEQLTPREAWRLTEMLKGSSARESRRSTAPAAAGLFG